MEGRHLHNGHDCSCCYDDRRRECIQVTNLLWGLSLMGSCDLDVWAALHSHLAWLGETAEKLPEEALTQVYQVSELLLLLLLL